MFLIYHVRYWNSDAYTHTIGTRVDMNFTVRVLYKLILYAVHNSYNKIRVSRPSILCDHVKYERYSFNHKLSVFGINYMLYRIHLFNISATKISINLFSIQIIQHMNGTKAISTLIFRPMPDDDGTLLKCEGSNPRLPNSALEDSMTLNVMCKFSMIIILSYCYCEKDGQFCFLFIIWFYKRSYG